MLDFRSHSKYEVKPLELVVIDPFGLDPRYTDFGEIQFLSNASYNIVEKERKV